MSWLYTDCFVTLPGSRAAQHVKLLWKLYDWSTSKLQIHAKSFNYRELCNIVYDTHSVTVRVPILVVIEAQPRGCNLTPIIWNQKNVCNAIYMSLLYESVNDVVNCMDKKIAFEDRS